MDEKPLKVLITGGSSGLGRKMAERLYKQGHQVYVFSKTRKTEIDPSYFSILSGYTECDLSNINELEACFNNLINNIERIDVLINNAAERRFDKKLGQFQTSEIQRIINVDFLAPIILSNLCFPIMKRNNFGRIINISSIGAYKVFVTGSLYSSSKRALIAFGETLNLELSNSGGGVTVNTICPDAFSKMDGTPLKNYRRLTDSILVNTDRIIQSESSGMVIPVFSFKHKLRESLRLIKRAFQMLIS
jgi:NAD(P)-dependent dehydrogenase (short-subunit alcohol dehydrogenase family)